MGIPFIERCESSLPVFQGLCSTPKPGIDDELLVAFANNMEVELVPFNKFGFNEMALRSVGFRFNSSGRSLLSTNKLLLAVVELLLLLFITGLVMAPFNSWAARSSSGVGMIWLVGNEMEDDGDDTCSAVANRSVPALDVACARDIADVVCTNKSSTLVTLPMAAAVTALPFVNGELCVSSVVVDVGISYL